MAEHNDIGIHDLCEICGVNNAVVVKGGINFNTGKRGLFYCCTVCEQRIEDERTKHRGK